MSEQVFKPAGLRAGADCFFDVVPCVGITTLWQNPSEFRPVTGHWDELCFLLRNARMKLSLLGRLTIFLVLCGCTVGGGGGSQYQVRKLSSGKSVKVIGVGQMNFPDSGPALLLKYETDIKILDKVALRREADEIWTDFRADVERAMVSSAILSANAPQQGSIIQKNEGYNFVFVKQPDGAWNCNDDH